MLAFKSVLEQSETLRKLLVSPIITRHRALQVVETVLTSLSASDLTHKFFALLARQRRLSLALIAANEYLAMLAESRGELTVLVTLCQNINRAAAGRADPSIDHGHPQKSRC